MAWFLYESEERTIQNQMEDWWIRFDELRSDVVSRQAAFLRVLAEKAVSFLNRFGGVLYSAKSFAIVLFLVACHFAWVISSSGNEPAFVLSDLPVVIAVYVGTLVAGIGLTQVTIAALKRVLMRIARSMSEWSIFLLAGFTPLIFLFLVLFSLFLSTPLFVLDHIRLDGEGLPSTGVSAMGLLFAGAQSLLLSLIVIILGIVIVLQGAAGLMLMHKAAWPILSRILYAFPRYRLISNKKLLNAVGFLMITIALAPTAGWGRLLKVVGAG
jgi:hypothetical protein